MVYGIIMDSVKKSVVTRNFSFSTNEELGIIMEKRDNCHNYIILIL